PVVPDTARRPRRRRALRAGRSAPMLDVPPTPTGETHMSDQTTPQDPTTEHPQPEQPADDLQPPGRTGDMSQEPDHGASTHGAAAGLAGERALTPGAAPGRGRAAARGCAREGAAGAISYLPEEEEDARTTARRVEDAGRTAVLLPGDIRDEEFCRRLVADA